MRRLMLAGAAVLLLSACAEPFIVFAGGKLNGKTADPPADWSLLTNIDTVQLETRPSDPYSVNVWAVGIGSDIYVATSKRGTHWTKNIEADGNVRLRVTDTVYPLHAVPVIDPRERHRVSQAYGSKYGLDADDNWVIKGKIFRLDRR